MNRDEVIRMACSVWGEQAILTFAELERFAALVSVAELEAAQTRIRQLCDLVRRVHKAKGRYHTQLAICDLYEAVGLLFERPNKSTNYQTQPKE